MTSGVNNVANFQECQIVSPPACSPSTKPERDRQESRPFHRWKNSWCCVKSEGQMSLRDYKVVWHPSILMAKAKVDVHFNSWDRAVDVLSPVFGE